ncbi:hypothetical protein H0H92_014498 [Tricholoma furcatifolium]|nr:hypothetical protein H0H92_014498 [Tricholoma furcatifolium]
MQLSGSKTHKLLTTKSRSHVHVVKPEWVFDSIKAGKKKPEREYAILKNSTMKTLHDMVQKNASRSGGAGGPRWIGASQFSVIRRHYNEFLGQGQEWAVQRYYLGKDASGPGKKYYVPQNEGEGNIDALHEHLLNVFSGNNTLHGGTDGFDRRTWTVAEKSANSVTFTMVDPNGMEGFPGTVTTAVKYTLEPKSTWKISMNAVATELTPIMLSGHHYWNFEAFQETQDLVGHHAQFQASKFVTTDGALIPTGQLTDVTGTPMDFRQAKSIGASINATASAAYCGTGCVGFDNCWVYDDNDAKTPAFSMWSVNSGIKCTPAIVFLTPQSQFQENTIKEGRLHSTMTTLAL